MFPYPSPYFNKMSRRLFCSNLIRTMTKGVGREVGSQDKMEFENENDLTTEHL